MPQKGKSGITVDTETLEVLKQDKPDGVTWDYYLTEIRTVEQTKELVADE